jgi:hypothetical protein
MSSPSEVSEKAVWLENNMPKWLVYCNIEAIDDVHDVMSVVLAHLSPRGVEELHLLVSELFEEDELTPTSTDERMYNYGGTNGD